MLGTFLCDQIIKHTMKQWMKGNTPVWQEALISTQRLHLNKCSLETDE